MTVTFICSNGHKLDLVKIFNLRQIPVCKYVACMYAQDLQWRRRVLPEQEIDLVLVGD